ncbi:MAG: hypothetical protein WC915_02615 [archaeon]|jgi:hypothetical protein
MKKIILVLSLLICISFVFSSSVQDTLWEGYVNVEINKEIFNEDENISGSIIISNSEYMPAFGQTIVLQLNQGQYDYPSQFANDNVIDELTLKDNWILPRTKKKIEFSFKPHASGQYHIDTYVWTMKSMLVGADSIFLSPTITKINIDGINKNKDITIDRLNTVFEGENGPVGFPVEPGKEFSGNIVINNKENTNVENLKLKLSICDWSCALNKEEPIKEINIPIVNANSKTNIDVSLIAPEIPSAYEIKMDLFDGNRVLSQYKNRVIVIGGTAKIRKIYLNNVKGNLVLTSILSGSPDHFNFPDFENFVLELNIYKDNAQIEQKENEFDLIKSGEIIDSTFEINSKDFTSLCLIIKKDNKIFEKECLEVPLLEAQQEYDILFPSIVDVKWNYLESDKLLTINLTKNINIDSIVRIIQNGSVIYTKTITGTKSALETLTLERGQYVLTVDDITAKRQIVNELNLGNILEEITASEVTNEKLICTGQVCTNNTVCDTTPYNSKDGVCCTSSCIDPIQSNGFDLTQIPFILWVAVLLLITGIIILTNSIKKMGENK